MQPIIAIIAKAEGILYLNGHFAGEAAPDQPLLRPVSPRGALILEYRPYSDDFRPITRRLVFSGSEPLPASAEALTGVQLAVWPGGVTEIELSPPPARMRSRTFQIGGHAFSIEGEALLRDGNKIAALPEDAEIPEVVPISNGAALRGKCAAGTYLLTFDHSFSAQTGGLTADELRIEADGSIRAMRARGDLAGHGALETWRQTSEGLVRIASESVWTHGAPRWPQTPAETARAFIEACLAGLDGEAEGYCTPAVRGRISSEEIRRRSDSCAEMRYAPPDARPCAALVKLEGENLARITPMCYACVPSGSIQGPYKLEAITFDRPVSDEAQEFNMTIY